MPVEALPPEIWAMVIQTVDDYCFAWFVLRRVSPFLRQVTEDVFATRIIRDCRIRFAGNYARSIASDAMEAKHSMASIGNTTFSFNATNFSPPTTKEKVVLRLQDQFCWPGCPLCCLGHQPFFAQTRRTEALLSKEAQFIRHHGELRCHKLPSVALDRVRKEISLDWRALCQTLYYQELKERQVRRPWIRHVTSVTNGTNPMQIRFYGEAGKQLKLRYQTWGREELLEGCKEDGWIFWATPRDENDVITLNLHSRHHKRKRATTHTTKHSYSLRRPRLQF
ncbi:hypothetical protein CC78DRAFT_544285 [Lojkania enalia]|uniref:Uncharacterized protein n=1 Tax=Lojkania enalia TaxID=147567 RepID=A0A9P4K7N1_9PLEO|nr:hypothetical protein CC78DRAFT_544285 [Didymosphaeria enalia]